jgi:hypothetical protein
MRLFGRHLTQKGHVTNEDVLEALNRQRSAHQTIGQIAVRLSRLTPRQVLDILNRQVGGDDRPFGEIAVSMGYLKTEDVAMLLKEQEKSIKALGETLVDMGILTQETMERELEEFLQIQRPIQKTPAP